MSKDDKDYKTGFKNPPKEHQFKKGQSGNPKGRKKGIKNINHMYQDLLKEKIIVHLPEGTRKITIQEAIARRVTSDALKGKDRAIERVLVHAPKSSEEEVRLTAQEWAETLNYDGLTNEELTILLKFTTPNNSPKK